MVNVSEYTMDGMGLNATYFGFWRESNLMLMCV